MVISFILFYFFIGAVIWYFSDSKKVKEGCDENLYNSIDLVNPKIPRQNNISNLINLEKEVSELPEDEFYSFQKRWLNANKERFEVK